MRCIRNNPVLTGFLKCSINFAKWSEPRFYSWLVRYGLIEYSIITIWCLPWFRLTDIFLEYISRHNDYGTDSVQRIISTENATEDNFAIWFEVWRSASIFEKFWVIDNFIIFLNFHPTPPFAPPLHHLSAPPPAPPPISK